MRLNKLSRGPMWFLALLAVAGCIFDDDSETSNEPAPPPPDISAGIGTDRQIPGNPGGKDSVFLVFAADSGKTYRLSATDSNSKISMHVENLDSVLQYTSKAVDFTHKNSLLDFPCTKTGSYYLVLVGPTGTSLHASLTEQVGLPVNFVGPDPFEPDSNMHLAQPVLADGNWNRRTATSGLVGDVDWFWVKVRPGFTYSFEFKDSLVLYGTTRSLWGGDSTIIGAPSTGNLEFASFDSGKIWLRTDGNASGARYRLRATETAGYPAGSTRPDADESDDTLHPAALKTDSGFVARNMHGQSTSRDIDWTEIVVTRGRTWAVALWDTTGSISARLSGLPAGIAAKVATSGWKGKAYLTTWTFPAPYDGKVLLRTAGSKTGGYALQAWNAGPLPDSIRMQDAWETDSKSSPMILKADSQEVSRTFHGIRTSTDSDWIALDLDSGRTYFLRMRDTAGNILTETSGLPAGISVAEADESAIGERGTDATGAFPAIAKGRLLLQLRDSFAVGYSLTAWSRPGLPDSLLPERGEPDDSRENAFPISIDSPSVVKRVARRDTDWVSVRNPAGSGAVLRIKNLGGGVLAWRPSPSSPIRQLSPGRTDSVYLFSLRSQRILAEIWNTDTSGTRIQYSLQAGSVALPPDALDPDDDATAPTTLLRGSPFADRWTSPDDTDWMALDLPDGLAAKVWWIAGQGAGLEAFSASLQPLPMLAPEKHGDTLVKYLANSGRVLLRASGSTPAITSYKIRFDTLTLDPDEPSTSRERPLRIAFDSIGAKLWIPASDTDWLQVATRPGGSYLYTNVANVSVSVLFDGTEVSPEAVSSGWSSWSARKAGTLVFRLIGRTSGGSTALPAPTNFQVREIMTDTLFGDSLEPSSLLADGGIVTRLVGQETTRWMSAPTRIGKSYYFGSTTSNSTVYITLYADGKVVGSGWSGNTRASWTAKSDGRVLVKLESRGYLTKPPDTSRFSLFEWQEEADEPNDDSLHASALPTDSSVQTRFNRHSDVDYFKIEMEPGRWYSVTIDAPENSKLYLLDSLYHGGWFALGGTGPETFDLGATETPATRHIRFNPLGSSDFMSYRIAVSSRALQNTVARSILLKPDSSLVSGSIPSNATNLLRLPVKPGRKYRLEIDAPTFTDIHILKGSDSASQYARHHATFDSIDLGTSEDTGSWFLRIVPNGRSAIDYRVRAIESYQEPSEPDSPEQPSKIYLGQAKTLEGDEDDWLELPKVMQASSIKVTCATSEVDWEVVGPFGSSIGTLSYQDAGSPQSRIYSIDPSTTGYLMHVRRKTPGSTVLSYTPDYTFQW